MAFLPINFLPLPAPTDNQFSPSASTNQQSIFSLFWHHPTRQLLVKIGEGQQKLKIVHSNKGGARTMEIGPFRNQNLIF